jgi:hypothetical protein
MMIHQLKKKFVKLSNKCDKVKHLASPTPVIEQTWVEPRSRCISVNGYERKQGLVHDCPFETSAPRGMREHFQRHIQDNAIIVEEGHVPRC